MGRNFGPPRAAPPRNAWLGYCLFLNNEHCRIPELSYPTKVKMDPIETYHSNGSENIYFCPYYQALRSSSLRPSVHLHRHHRPRQPVLAGLGTAQSRPGAGPETNNGRPTGPAVLKQAYQTACPIQPAATGAAKRVTNTMGRDGSVLGYPMLAHSGQ